MKDVLIKITGKRFNGSDSSDDMEFFSDGKMYQRGSARYIVYDEKSRLGDDDCKTTLRLKDGTLRMRRFERPDNVLVSEMEFAPGKRVTGRYSTPYGSVNMEILTNSIDSHFDENGHGSIKLNYDICFDGIGDGRNEIEISVTE